MTNTAPEKLEESKSLSPPSLELLQQLKREGMTEQVKMLEKKYGINVTEVEEILTGFITQDPTCIQIKNQIVLLASHDDSVLIHGETGTGKELLAKALHGNRKGRFIPINCAGMPSELVESELFGHVAGSFTGAREGQPGLIELANGGTLFLDEIGDLPLHVQAKLLRVMQDKCIRPVGGKQFKTIEVRFVAATHHDLKDLTQKGLFRLDLFARLSTFQIDIPPLRDRLEDIHPIAKAYDKSLKFNSLKYDWKEIDLSHNVRSLQSIIRRYIVLGLEPKHISKV